MCNACMLRDTCSSVAQPMQPVSKGSTAYDADEDLEVETLDEPKILPGAHQLHVLVDSFRTVHATEHMFGI